MRAVKRKAAYITNDGMLHPTKRLAESHVRGIVANLEGARYRVKRLAAEQKSDKKLLAICWKEKKGAWTPAFYQVKINRRKWEIKCAIDQIKLHRSRLKGK